ncbi:MAG: hypothetical protein HYZ42_08310 [Bacteroidetes bacterium]|nr:hypothetical protein [Bacteroidota bacterium]
MQISDIENRINELIATQESYHVNDLRVYDLWHQMTDILSMDMDKTIAYLESQSQERLSWVSQVFPDVMERTNNRDFLNYLTNLIEKDPHIKFKPMIEAAINYFIE